MEFKEMKKILNADSEKYSDEQIREIGEFTAMLADIIVRNDLLEVLCKEKTDSLNANSQT